MPRLRGRGRNIGRRTRNSQLVWNCRLNSSAEDQLTENENLSNQAAITRATESQEQRNERLRAKVPIERLERQRVTDTFRTREQQRLQVYHALTRASFPRLAFKYESDIDYSSHSQIVIGAINKQCHYCHALKYKGELDGYCCASGKFILPPLNSPPEPLRALLAGATSQCKLFLRIIRNLIRAFK